MYVHSPASIRISSQTSNIQRTLNFLLGLMYVLINRQRTFAYFLQLLVLLHFDSKPAASLQKGHNQIQKS